MIRAFRYDGPGQRFEPREQQDRQIEGQHKHIHLHLDLSFRARQRRWAQPGQNTRVFLIGLLIGSLSWLPYLALALIWPFFWPYFTARDGISHPWPFGIVSGLFLLWPLFFLCQGVLGLYFLRFARPRRRLLASGILMMLALLILAIALGWLPSPNYVNGYILGAF